MRRFNLFTVFFYGGIALFLFCLGKLIINTIGSFIGDPFGFIGEVLTFGERDYTIFDFIGKLLDQLM